MKYINNSFRHAYGTLIIVCKLIVKDARSNINILHMHFFFHNNTSDLKDYLGPGFWDSDIIGLCCKLNWGLFKSPKGRKTRRGRPC